MKISMNKKYRTRDKEKVRVICIDRDAPYPVVALIGTHSCVKTFTDDGRSDDGRCMALINHPDDLIEVPEWSDFQVDEPVMVKYEGEVSWKHRYFAGIDEYGKPKAWLGGATSWSVENYATTAWNECRRPTTES